jgi:hypothetical protein
MVEKMTAVWLIILTIIVCASVPAIIIYATSIPHLLGDVQFIESMNHVLAIRQ